MSSTLHTETCSRDNRGNYMISTIQTDSLSSTGWSIDDHLQGVLDHHYISQLVRNHNTFVCDTMMINWTGLRSIFYIFSWIDEVNSWLFRPQLEADDDLILIRVRFSCWVSMIRRQWMNSLVDWIFIRRRAPACSCLWPRLDHTNQMNHNINIPGQHSFTKIQDPGDDEPGNTVSMIQTFLIHIF